MRDQLIFDGIVKEDGAGVSTGGRKPLTFTLCAGSIYAIAVIVEQPVTSIALIDIHNNHIKQLVKAELPLLAGIEYSAHLARHINRLIEACCIAKKKIAGITIGMLGVINFGFNKTIVFNKESRVSYNI